jgi:hypothetical protein
MHNLCILKYTSFEIQRGLILKLYVLYDYLHIFVPCRLLSVKTLFIIPDMKEILQT